MERTEDLRRRHEEEKQAEDMKNGTWAEKGKERYTGEESEKRMTIGKEKRN